MNCSWPWESLVIAKTSAIASLITPLSSLPRPLADTAGPEVLFLALSSTVSITTCMSLAGAFRTRPAEQFLRCSTRTERAPHFAAFWSRSYQNMHRASQFFKWGFAFALFCIRTVSTPSKLMPYVLLLNIMQKDKLGYSQPPQLPVLLCILQWAPVKSVNILSYLITLNVVSVNCMCSLSYHNKFLYSHSWNNNVFL